VEVGFTPPAVAAGDEFAPYSLGLLTTSQQHFSLRTNQPPATNQQYFSLRTNRHQPSATSQTNRLLVDIAGGGHSGVGRVNWDDGSFVPPFFGFALDCAELICQSQKLKGERALPLALWREPSRFGNPRSIKPNWRQKEKEKKVTNQKEESNLSSRAISSVSGGWWVPPSAAGGGGGRRP
jgi:hypothetical protein